MPEEAPPIVTPGPDQPPFLLRWWRFVRMRFDPLANTTMAVAFVAGNAVLADAADFGLAGSLRFASVAIAILLMFMRLRILDEIKDRVTDRALHPERPFVSGLICPWEGAKVAVAIASIECVLVAFCGRLAVVAWSMAFLFSLLMFKEFFIGPWLRKRMELYAITHTFVAAFMGLVVVCAISGQAPWRFPPSVYWFALGNWATFTLYEFGRKTWGRDEEREGVESYSKRLHPTGAAILSLVCCGAALWLMGSGYVHAMHCLDQFGPLLLTWLALALLALLPAIAYMIHPHRACARVFRGSITAILVLVYAIPAAILFFEDGCR